jgi:hypothetical protein
MKNLTMIAREFDLGLTKETLTAMYKDATADKQNFLMIDLETTPEDRFRKGFSDYYDIETQNNL